MKTVSFDFDGVCVYKDEKPRPHVVKIMNELNEKGYRVVVLTTRRDMHLPEVYEFVKNLNFQCEVFNTNHTWKGEWLMQKINEDFFENHVAHLDDNFEEFLVWVKQKVEVKTGAKFFSMGSFHKFEKFFNTRTVK